MLLFKREDRFVLDSSSILDGRVVRLFEKKYFEGKIIIPQLVKSILKKITEGKVDRIFSILKKNAPLEFVLDRSDGLVEEVCVFKVAGRTRAKVVTASDEICRIAKFYSRIKVIDIRELYRTLIPIFSPDTMISVRILKRGLHANEGVGYIEGVKIVVDNGARFVNQTVNARVSTMLMSETGNLVFATIDKDQINSMQTNIVPEQV